MKASVILAHPYNESFNHAIYGEVCSSLKECGVEVFAHDLYAENFNPVMTVGELGKAKSEDDLVNRYADELVASDFLFIIHPNWWGQPPAIMKGWVDRVIRPPYAYDMPEGALSGMPIAKLKGKTGVVYTTSNTDAETEEGYFGDPIDKIWGKCTFGFTGIEDYHRRMFRIVSESDLSTREGWLADVRADVIKLTSR